MPTQLTESSRAAITADALDSLRNTLPHLLASMSDVLWMSDRSGSTYFISQSVERILGFTPEEIYEGGTEIWFGRIHPDDTLRVRDAYRQLLERGDCFDAEYRILREDGRWIWIHDRAIAIGCTNGEPTTVCGIFSDITERKSAELFQAGQNRVLELVATGARLEDALTSLARTIEAQFDGLLCSVLLLSPDGQHLLHGAAPSLPEVYNRAIHGLSIGPVVGSCGTAAHRRERVIVTDIALDPLWGNFAELGLSHGLRACWSQPILSSRSDLLGTFAMYYRVPKSPGAREIALIEAAAHLAGIAIENHRAGVSLLLAKEAAEAASRFKSDFLATMSHEIRTPMTAILGYAELLLDETCTQEERPGYVEIIRENGLHLLSIINDILDLSKIEAGRLSVECIPCSPKRIVEEVTCLLLSRAQAKGLDLYVEFHEPIPDVIQSDPTRLRQILVNLVGNAIKFTSAGSVLLTVNQLETLDPGDSRLCFEVLDTGPGMTPEQRVQLFKPYTQADVTVARRHGGTGLGLAISKRLAGLLGGDIFVQTSLGEGSSFILAIDAGPPWEKLQVDPTASVAGPAALAGPPQLEQARLQGRVLLAEDIAVNQKLISFHLRKSGLAVEIVDNGRDAVNAALAASRNHTPYDVIFMDIYMPILDGISATQELRREGYGGAIVAITARAMSGDRERCLQSGFDGFMTKPVNQSELLEIAAQHARKREE